MASPAKNSSEEARKRPPFVRRTSAHARATRHGARRHSLHSCQRGNRVASQPRGSSLRSRGARAASQPRGSGRSNRTNALTAGSPSDVRARKGQGGATRRPFLRVSTTFEGRSASARVSRPTYRARMRWRVRDAAACPSCRRDLRGTKRERVGVAFDVRRSHGVDGGRRGGHSFVVRPSTRGRKRKSARVDGVRRARSKRGCGEAQPGGTGAVLPDGAGTSGTAPASGSSASGVSGGLSGPHADAAAPIATSASTIQETAFMFLRPSEPKVSDVFILLPFRRSSARASSPSTRF